MKAFKIKTLLDDGFSIQLAETAGAAKTFVVNELGDAGYRKASYSWITSCRRAPEFDYLAEKGPGCVAWSHEGERWQIDKGHWWLGDDVAPNIACTGQAASGLQSENISMAACR